MRRIFLIFVILTMCGIVFVGGNITFVSSNSVLKHSIKSNTDKSDYKILIDLTENKLYLINNNDIINSYPVSPGKKESASPIGNWKIVQKNVEDKGSMGNWLGLNVPWGTYGIHGPAEPMENSGSESHECIVMQNKDIQRLYKLVGVGTEVIVYGGPYGAFGVGHKAINYGDRGADVYEIQKKLMKLGFYKGPVNGIYGEDLRTAVHKFQADKELEVKDTLGEAFYSKLGIMSIE